MLSTAARGHICTLQFLLRVTDKDSCAAHVLALTEGNNAIKKRGNCQGRKGTIDSTVVVPRDVSRILIESSEDISGQVRYERRCQYLCLLLFRICKLNNFCLLAATLKILFVFISEKSKEPISMQISASKISGPP